MIFEEEKPPTNLVEVNRSNRETRSKVATKLGISPTQYDKIKTVHTKAPEPAQASNNNPKAHK